MPDYVPIQDLTLVNSIGNNDLIPMSDGSGAYAVKGSTIKSYAASDAQAAAADAALSKTAAQNAATAAALAQGIAEDAAEDATDALAEATAVRAEIGVLPGVFADNPITAKYIVSGIFESGYITNTGGNGSNSANARSVYFALNEIKAVCIPYDYKVKFVWYSQMSQEGYIAHDTINHTCGAGIAVYVAPPATANYFRMQVAKQSGETITSDDRLALNTYTLLYTVKRYEERDNALAVAADAVLSNPLYLSYHNPVFSLTKGKAFSTDDGHVVTDSTRARSGIVDCRQNAAYAISYDSNFEARVFFYTDSSSFPTEENETFISYINQRFNNNGHKVVYITPSTAYGVSFDFRAIDGHTITDEDMTTLSNSFRLYTTATALKTETVYSADSARERFVDYMVEMCEKLGMDDTTFANASGLTSESVTTAADELKMALAVAGNPVACDIWSTQSRDFDIGGSNARTISVTSNVFSDWLTETTYRKLGGKGGTLEKTASASLGTARKAACVMHNISGIPVALALIGRGDYTFSHMVDCTQELCGMMATKLSGGTPTEGTNLTRLISDGGGYAALPVPINANSYVNTYDAEQILTRDNALYHNEAIENMPASTTKVMTMLCALRVMPDLNEVVKVITGDIKGGSGSTFYNGDKLTLIDALRIMMMESSNTLAECIGRVVGDRLLTIEAERG